MQQPPIVVGVPATGAPSAPSSARPRSPHMEEGNTSPPAKVSKTGKAPGADFSSSMLSRGDLVLKEKLGHGACGFASLGRCVLGLSVSGSVQPASIMCQLHSSGPCHCSAHTYPICTNIRHCLSAQIPYSMSCLSVVCQHTMLQVSSRFRFDQALHLFTTLQLVRPASGCQVCGCLQLQALGRAAAT